MKRLYLFFSFILMLLVIAGCSEEKPAAQSSVEQRITVFSGIPPVSTIAAAIGGKYVAVETLLPPGQSPHSFTPRPATIKALGKAKLYIAVNMPFEKNIIVPLLKKNKVALCMADKGVDKIAMGAHHHHDGEGEHKPHDEQHAAAAVEAVHGKQTLANPDPHIWLSTVNDIIIAKNITDSLCQVDPAHAASYRKNCAALSVKFSTIKKRLAKLLSPYKGDTFYVYHPAFGYFAHEFGLKQEAVEHNGKQPTPKELAQLIKNARNDGVKFIFVQPRFSQRSADIIAEQLGGQVIRLDPLSSDLLKNYLTIADSIAAAMRKPTPNRE